MPLFGYWVERFQNLSNKGVIDFGSAILVWNHICDFKSNRSILISDYSVQLPLLIYQHSNMAPRLLGQTSIFGKASFLSKVLLGIERQKKTLKNYNFDPRSHARILIYRMWPIPKFGLYLSCRGFQWLSLLFLLHFLWSRPLSFALKTDVK